MRFRSPVTPPGIARVAVGLFSRGSAGAQAITGLGFTPKIIIFLAYGSGGATEIHSHGFDNAILAHCTYKMGDGEIMYGSTVRSIVVAVGAANFIRGYVSSMDPDGFTVTWDLTGAATANVFYLALC